MDQDKSQYKQGKKSKTTILIVIVGFVFLCGLLVVFLISAFGITSMIQQARVRSAQTTATAEYLHCNQRFEDEMARLLSEFFRQQSIADVTPRIVIPEQISHLEDIRKEAWNMPEKSCQPKMHALLMDYMDKSIEKYIRFSADDYSWLDFEYDSLNALASLDDEVCKVYNKKGLIGLFRSKGYFYWDKLDDSNWKTGG